MRALELIDTWPVPTVAAAVISPTTTSTRGATDVVMRLASISKLVSAWAVLIAVEDGSIDLSDLVQPPAPAGTAVTVRQLLSHAGGYSFDGPVQITSPGRNRIYSNTGYELLAEYVTSRTGIPFTEYVREAVFEPLGMTTAAATGSPAKDFRGALGDMVAFAGELRRPRLIAATTASEATTVQFPELGGVLPGVGRFSPNPWGLGPEIRGVKQPHWTGAANSPATFGHFGGSGTFIWVDPALDIACVMLAKREFTAWGLEFWPPLSDAIIAEHVAGSPAPAPPSRR